MKFNLESVLLLIIPMVNPLIEKVKKEKPELAADGREDDLTAAVMGKLKNELRKKIGPAVDLLWLTDIDEKVAQVVRIMV